MKNKLKECYKELIEKLDLMETNLTQIQEYVSELKKNHGCAIADMERDEQSAVEHDGTAGSAIVRPTTDN